MSGVQRVPSFKEDLSGADGKAMSLESWTRVASDVRLEDSAAGFVV